MSRHPDPGHRRGNRIVALISAALLAVVVVLVGLSLRREPPESYPPTLLEPRTIGDSLVGPVRVTLDASDGERWVYFDFSRGATPVRPGPREWDLAFRRFNIAVNGGAGFEGDAGVIALPGASFENIRSAPATGYTESEARRDSANPAIERWYDYGFTSHLLTPKPVVYLIRTADGRFARLRFLSYYCPGARPGCITFEYVYQGDGSREL